jgi:hypothetical protein
VLTVGIALYYAVSEFKGLGDADAMDFAVSARELARGNGFTTKSIKPLGLSQISIREQAKTLKVNPKINVHAFPDLYNPPVFPLTLAAIFKIFRTNFKPKLEQFRNYKIYSPDWVPIIFSQICVLLTVLLINSFGSNLFDRRVGFLSGTLFIFSDLVWKFSISGLSTSLVMFEFMMACWLTNKACDEEEKEKSTMSLVWMALAGLALGFCVLTRYELFWMLPAFGAAFCVHFRNKLYLPLTALGLALLVSAPWLVRNYVVTGKPLGGNLALISTSDDDHAGQDLLRSHRAEDQRISLKNVVRKEFVGWRYYMNNGWEMLGSSLVIAFFVVGLLHPFRRNRAKTWRLFIIASFVLLTLGTCIFYSKPPVLSVHNNIVLLLPLVLFFGISIFYIYLDKMDIKIEILRYVYTIIFSLICSLNFILTLLPPSSGYFQYPPYHPPVLYILSDLFERDEVICSDIPSGFAWYTDHTTIDLPYRMSDYLRINDYITFISGVVLTPESMNQPLLLQVDKGKYRDWAPALHRLRAPDNFPLTFCSPVPPNENEYYLMSDRPRLK